MAKTRIKDSKARNVRGMNKIQMQRRCEKSFEILVPDVFEAVSAIDQGTQFVTRVSVLTGMETTPIPKSSTSNLETIVKKSRAAQKRWALTSPIHRAAIIARIHDAIFEKSEEFCDLIQWETGKARVHAFEEIQDIALTSRYYGKVGAKALKPQKKRGVIPGFTRVELRHEPKGVVCVISPWNYPLTLTLGDALAALTAGNSVILKPDSNTPLTALAAKQLLVKAGLEPDLYQIVIGTGKEWGDPLIEAADYLMFTGSSSTGSMLAAKCGKRLIGCSAELGGKNAMIVTEKANLRSAARSAVRACYSNAGQLCISIERIYVQATVYERFKKLFIKQVEQMRVAANMDPETDMGVLITPEHLGKVDKQLRQAKKLGARVLTGGRPLKHLGKTAYAPTVLENVSEQMELCRSETFGPVVSLYSYDSIQSAIRMVNDSNYGLNASVWSTAKDGLRIARRIQSGTVNINEGYAPAWASKKVPMGGVKDSGLGRRHALEGLYKYTEPVSIAIQSPLAPIAAPKYLSNARWTKIVTRLLKVLKRLGFE